MQDLLALLDHPDSNRGSARVLIAEALKSLTVSLTHGEQVSAILNESPVWKQYSQQKHDLFIQNEGSKQITHAAAGVAGYLTSTGSGTGGAKAMPASVPPPSMEDMSNNPAMKNPLL